jgi:hypothetical protein
LTPGNDAELLAAHAVEDKPTPGRRTSKEHDMKAIRILRSLATLTAAAGLVTAIGVGSASAATTTHPSVTSITCMKCITPPPPSNNGAVSGKVNMTTCTAAPKIFVSSGATGQYASVTSTGNNTWNYFAGNVSPGTATVYPSNGCPLGQWSPASVSTYVPPQIIALAPQLAYTMPAHTKTIDGLLIAAGAQSKFSDLKLHLNDYGPQHGNSHQANNSSYLSTGSTYLPFNIPEVSSNMKLCSSFLCPSLGHADYYVNDMNLSSTSFAWTDAGTLQMTVSFESAGRELKGFYTNGLVGETDDAMPDADINNATVTIALMPVADGAGGVTFEVSGTPSFQGTIQATGACSVFGWDWCDSLTGYKGTISSAFSNAALAALDSSAVQHEISTQVRPILTSLGIGNVTGVSVQGSNVVVAYS